MDTVDTRHDAPPDAESSEARLHTHRRQEIYRLALKHGSVEVADLAQRWEVTTETIRRDLSKLQGEGLVRRVHGGAVPVSSTPFEPLLSERDRHMVEEKQRIAALALRELDDAQTVLVDSGSTTFRIAEVFPTDTGAHVITNSLPSGHRMAARGVTPMTVLGGGVTPNTLAMVDSRAVAMVRDLTVDVLFISCDGLSLQHGLTTPILEEKTLKRAMIEAATRVVAVVDSSKIGHDHLYAFAAFPELDVLVTDTGADPDSVAALRDQGVDVRLA